MKNFSVPKNIAHASGMYFAKEAIKTIVIFMALVIICFALLHSYWSEVPNIFGELIALTVFLIFFLSIFSYIDGFKNQRKRLQFLENLENEITREIGNMVIFDKSEIQKGIIKAVLERKSDIEKTLNPFIQNYLKIDPVDDRDSKKAWDELSYAQSSIEEAIEKKVFQKKQMQKIARGLEVTLTNVVYNAISDKKEIDFTVEKWLEGIKIDPTKIEAMIIKKREGSKNHLKEQLDKIKQLKAVFAQHIPG